MHEVAQSRPLRCSRVIHKILKSGGTTGCNPWCKWHLAKELPCKKQGRNWFYNHFQQRKFAPDLEPNGRFTWTKSHDNETLRTVGNYSKSILWEIIIWFCNWWVLKLNVKWKWIVLRDCNIFHGELKLVGSMGPIMEI